MPTAYVYDPCYLQHDMAQHPENKQRLEAIMTYLQDTGLLTRMQRLEARDASPDEIAAVHCPDYIAELRGLAAHGGGWPDSDTYVTPLSYAVALRAAGGLLQAVDAVLAGQAENAFALVRPPGHHATPDRAMGFCLFNNIAIAARYSLQKHGLARVLIVDWDLHHGNGTQEAFYENPHVLYFSMHQYPYYPGTGHWQETGRGAGQGYTVNVPLPAGTGDVGFQRVFDEILVPVARRFRPQLILVSAGYDAHWMDPIGMLQASVSGFVRMTRALVVLADELCNRRLVLTLEGGYNLQALAASVAATCAALMGDPEIKDPLGPARQAEASVDSVINSVKRAHGLS